MEVNGCRESENARDDVEFGTSRWIESEVCVRRNLEGSERVFGEPIPKGLFDFIRSAFQIGGIESALLKGLCSVLVQGGDATNLQNGPILTPNDVFKPNLRATRHRMRMKCQEAR
jgi:hypothetical protein